jgi:hypothetical protein
MLCGTATMVETNVHSTPTTPSTTDEAFGSIDRNRTKKEHGQDTKMSPNTKVVAGKIATQH